MPRYARRIDRSFFRRVESAGLRGALGGALVFFLFSVAVAVHFRPGTIGLHDSAYYLDGARHLARGAGFVSAESDMDGWRLAIANWPPGFSLLMVPGLWLGLTVHTSAAFVLGSSYVVFLLSTYALLLLCTRKDPVIHLERALRGVFLWATDVREFLGAESSEGLVYRALLGSLLVLLAFGLGKAKFDFPGGVRIVWMTVAAYFFGLVFSASMHAFNSLLHPRFRRRRGRISLFSAWDACSFDPGDSGRGPNK